MTTKGNDAVTAEWCFYVFKFIKNNCKIRENAAWSWDSYHKEKCHLHGFCSHVCLHASGLLVFDDFAWLACVCGMLLRLVVHQKDCRKQQTIHKRTQRKRAEVISP